MKVVMQADEALVGRCIRGTTNWAAAVGKAVQDAVLQAHAGAAELESIRQRVARIGLDIDRAMRGKVNTESPVGTGRLQAIADLAAGPPGSGGWQAHAKDMERERDHYRQRAQTMYEHQQGQVWYWQGDGNDHPESMVNSLPVVIRADQLRALMPQCRGKVERHSDQSVLVAFGSCHEASVFEQALRADPAVEDPGMQHLHNLLFTAQRTTGEKQANAINEARLVLSKLRAKKPAPAVCETCNDNGMIGGPSYYAPDEGGDPCPDCAQQPGVTPDGEPSNVELRGMWHGAGGSFHGPNVETGTMPEAKLLPFLRELVLARQPTGELSEPVAWESTTPAYIKYVTQSRYEMFSPAVRRWYKPFKCASCAAPPAQQPAPSAASKAALAAIRAANMQLVRTGDDEFMLVKYKNAEAQCDGGKCGIGGYCEQCPAARATADSAQDEPLQAFDSPRAKALMRAWEEGWAACRDAEYVGEEAQNDAFNSSNTLTLCIAEDQQLPAPQADSQPAPVEVADAMADSQYLAGVSAGWNAANADDPNAALQKLHESRAGYLKPLSAARAPADSQPAPQGETNVQLDTDSNHSTPGQQWDVAGPVALGQPMGDGPDQAAGDPSAQGDKLLTVAERNIRSFLRSAVFKSESDREAALNCVDVLWEAAHASADSVLEDAALPMQPICVASDGIVRFNKNRMVNDLYEFSQPRGFGLNEMARRDYTQEERMQFAQLIGYSVSGYGSLSYASPESVEKADAIADLLIAARKQGANHD